MYRDATVAVVVPAYNEADAIADVLTAIPAYVDRVYAVDDASTDETWTEIQRVAGGAGTDRGDDSSGFPDSAVATDATDATDAPDDAARSAAPASSLTDGGVVSAGIVPIRHEENQGAGAALKTGYERAREDDVDVVVAMDADGQMDPDAMRELVEPVATGAAGYAKGNRLASPSYREEMPTFRLVGNWLLSVMTKVASGYWNVMDSQNGYTAISAEALDALDLSRVGDDHQYTNDVLVGLRVADVPVVDVPMDSTYGDEESTISLSGFVPRTSRSLFEGFCWRLTERHVARDFHPFSLCYGVGALAVVGSAFEQAFGEDDDDGSLLMALHGVALVIAGMILDRRENGVDATADPKRTEAASADADRAEAVSADADRAGSGETGHAERVDPGGSGDAIRSGRRAASKNRGEDA